MNKTELIDAIATDAEITKADAKKALEAFFSNVEKALKQGDKVAIVGFGSWSVSKKEAREARNPRTNEIIKVAAKNVVKFKAGSELSDAVNK